MRNFFIVFIILLGSLTLIGAGKPVAEEGIRITVTQLHNEKGHVLVSLFKDGTGYPDDANKAFAGLLPEGLLPTMSMKEAKNQTRYQRKKSDGFIYRFARRKLCGIYPA